MAEGECDLVVRGGTVVTAGGSGPGDVGIAGGKIVQLGGPLRGRREIDASGALVLPGGIDMHVHLARGGPPEPGVPSWTDDFHSGSRAAIAGGVTTVGNMTFPWPGQSLREALDRDRAAAAASAAVDYVLHPVLASPPPWPSCPAWPPTGTPASRSSWWTRPSRSTPTWSSRPLPKPGAAGC